jgi:heme exporter protein D
MQWNSVSEFFAMGTHGFYVWGSFGLTALVMLVESLQIRRQRAELIDQLRNEQLSERTSS